MVHPATDNLHGTDAYGDPNDNSNAWSRRFDNIEFDDFVFATGDRQL